MLKEVSLCLFISPSVRYLRLRAKGDFFGCCIRQRFDFFMYIYLIHEHLSIHIFFLAYYIRQTSDFLFANLLHNSLCLFVHQYVLLIISNSFASIDVIVLFCVLIMYVCIYVMRYLLAFGRIFGHFQYPAEYLAI